MAIAAESLMPGLLLPGAHRGGDQAAVASWLSTSARSRRRRLRAGSLDRHTLHKGDLPLARGILQAAARHNQVVAVSRLAVARPGRVALGEVVILVDAD